MIPITVRIEMTLSGDVPVFAVHNEEAIAKVQVQMDTKTLDGDIEIRDDLSHGDMSQLFTSLVGPIEVEKA